MKLNIATRRSALALWQAEHVRARLLTLAAVDAVELVPIVTEGDRILDKTLAKIGGKGLFIKELEQAMLDGRADLAVHSMKDVPAEPPPGFAFPAVLEREDPRDALVGSTLAALGDGATVGTSSLRRRAQLLAARPDLDIRPVRGNVQTRLGKCHDGEFAAIVLAVAGLKRLGLAHEIAEPLPTAVMLPAAGQGIIGIECREDRPGLIGLLAQLNDAVSARRIRAERAVAAGLGADCHAPLGAFAEPDDSGLRLTALVGAVDGSSVLRAEACGDGPQALADAVVAELLQRGAAKLMAEAAAHA